MEKQYAFGKFERQKDKLEKQALISVEIDTRIDLMHFLSWKIR